MITKISQNWFGSLANQTGQFKIGNQALTAWSFECSYLNDIALVIALNHTEVLMKRLSIMLLSAVFLFSSGTAIFAQDQNGPKQDLRNAGHSTKEAAKSTGKAVKKGTKKTVNAGAKKTKQGADKVEQKTK